jgi:hypothetical protein
MEVRAGAGRGKDAIAWLEERTGDGSAAAAGVAPNHAPSGCHRKMRKAAELVWRCRGIGACGLRRDRPSCRATGDGERILILTTKSLTDATM